MTKGEDIQTCKEFAANHKLIFEDEGTCGFGRECVGFLAKNGNWLDHNPTDSGDYTPIEAAACEAVRPPCDLVPDAYYKHDCMAVLGHGSHAVAQLAAWVRHLERAGNVRIVKYETGATGLQVMISGFISYAVVVG